MKLITRSFHPFFYWLILLQLFLYKTDNITAYEKSLVVAFLNAALIFFEASVLSGSIEQNIT